MLNLVFIVFSLFMMQNIQFFVGVMETLMKTWIASTEDLFT